VPLGRGGKIQDRYQNGADKDKHDLGDNQQGRDTGSHKNQQGKEKKEATIPRPRDGFSGGSRGFKDVSRELFFPGTARP
jgi:hypothetical protein